MPATPGNSMNLTSTTSGIVVWDGTSAISSVTGTNHNVLVGTGANSITSVAPSATSGIPLVSNGAAADPSFTTAVVAGGGTGSVTFTAYSVICAGTTATGLFQNVSGVGSSGNVLTSNGAGALPTWQASSTTNPLSTATFVDDFVYANPGTSITPWFAQASGTAAAASNADIISTNSFGIIGLSTGTTTTGSCGISAMSNAGTAYQVMEGNGAITIQWTYELASLSTVGDRFTIRLGLTDSATGAPANGAWFEYVDNVNSGNWVIKTSKASSVTSANTGTAVNTNLTTLKITIDAANSSYHFYVNGSEVTGSPLATNLPTAALMPTASIVKSAGTNARRLTLDLFQLTFVPTSARPG